MPSAMCRNAVRMASATTLKRSNTRLEYCSVRFQSAALTNIAVQANMTKKPKPAKPNATQTTFFACDFGTSVPWIITVSSLFLRLRLRLLIILSLFSTSGRSGVSVFLQNLPNVGIGVNV